MKEKLEKLKDVTYNLFLDRNNKPIISIELKGYIVMINTLINSYGINIDFRLFFEKINTTVSNRYKYFTKMFNKFVNKELYGKQEY